MARLYEYIRGDEILTLDDEEKVPLIYGMLNRGDYVLFVAEEKVGKTIWSQQLCCALSSGSMFLSTYEIPEPCKVWYMYNEVRKGQIADRFVRMSHAQKINVNNITLIPFKFRFNTEVGMKQLQTIIHENQGNKPDVIIVDSLYKAVKGSLKNDDVVNDFNHIFSSFAQSLGGCARIAVHHLTKPSKDETGKYQRRTDKDSFGSAFLLADVDHCFRLEKYGDNPDTPERILKCETQRSGEIVDSVRFTLIEPDPLYYEYVRLHVEKEADMVKLLNRFPSGLCLRDIIKYGKIKRSVLYEVLKSLQDKGIVQKRVNPDDGKTRIYQLNKQVKK